MTENQIYPISGDYFDTSSNSSNLLKFDLYSVAFSNSSTPTSTLSPQHSYNSNNNNNNSNSAAIECLREDSPMLTTPSILIPQRNSGGHNSSLYHQPKIMAEFSEFGLDVLDASSLSPNLLHDVSLNTANTSSSQSNNGGCENMIQTTSSSYSNSSTPINTGGNIILYEIPNSNTMWSDIGHAIITTKPEPFTIEDDYIFELDKQDLTSGPTLAELNDETLLEDLNIEDLVPAQHESYLINTLNSSSQNSGVNSIQHLNSPHSSSASSSGGGSNCGQLYRLQHHQQQQPNESNSPQNQQIPQQHQQQQQQQQQQQHNHHQQQQQEQQQQQSSQSHHQNQLNVQVRNNFDDCHTNVSQGSSSPYDIYHSTPTKSINSNVAFSPGSQASPNSPLMINSVTPPPHASRPRYHTQQSMSAIKLRSHHELLKKEYSMSPDHSILGQSVPGPSTSQLIMSGNALSPSSSGFGSAGRKSYGYQSNTSSRLSSSAPTQLGMEQIWQRREPRQHLLSTGSLAEAESYSSISTGSVLSPEGIDFSQDEGYSDYDSEHYEDYSSDNGSDNEDEHRSNPLNNPGGKGKERFFWQYNVQAKGPKGQRLVIKSQLEDPHVLNEVTDPVFSPNCSVRGIKVFKHSGKARKGDGNDLTPNPRKLHTIGKELDKLGRTINDMTPVSELPINVRPKSRKEKNKLASRACRLKKKAQHEANKIKLFGLEIEHKKLIGGLNDIKRALAIKYQNQGGDTGGDLNQRIERICQTATAGVQIAGGTTDFVNKVLDNVKSGVTSGGLEDLRTT